MNMNLSNEVRRKIAQKMSWNRLRAQGCDDGEFYKLSGRNIPGCIQSGLDEYSIGFRAGYYDLNDGDSDSYI